MATEPFARRQQKTCGGRHSSGSGPHCAPSAVDLRLVQPCTACLVCSARHVVCLVMSATAQWLMDLHDCRRWRVARASAAQKGDWIPTLGTGM
jgi:hypothetical protein